MLCGCGMEAKEKSKEDRGEEREKMKEKSQPALGMATAIVLYGCRVLGAIDVDLRSQIDSQEERVAGRRLDVGVRPNGWCRR